MAYLSFTPGRNYRWRDLQWYAMNGFICLHDETDGEFKPLTCDEWAQRIASFREEFGKIKADDGRFGIDRRRELQTLLEHMLAAYTEAKAQGDHMDPVVSAWFRRHRPWARSKVSMSGCLDGSHGAPGGTPLGMSAAQAQRAIANRLRMARGRFARDLVRADKSIPARPTRPQLLLPGRVY